MRKSKLPLMMSLVFLSLVLILAGCGAASGNNASSASAGTAAQSGEALAAASVEPEDGSAETTVFTKETLATYNGQNGNPAYVAINGVVYDVTAVPNWRGGTHNGNTAGLDLTDMLGKSPHGERVLKDLPVVGTYE